MLDPQRKLEREALLKRHREIQAELVQIERNLHEGEARLPIEEQLRLKLRWIIDTIAEGCIVERGKGDGAA
jgi:hypothetical protein